MTRAPPCLLMQVAGPMTASKRRQLVTPARLAAFVDVRTATLDCADGAGLAQVGDGPADSRAGHAEGVHQVFLGLDRLAGPELAAVDTALHPCRDLPVWRQFGAVVDLGRIHVIKVAEQRRCAPKRYLATRSATCL